MEAIVMYSSDPPPFHFFKDGGGEIWLPPPDGGSGKLKKGGGSTVQGQVFLKGEGLELSYLMLSRFIIFTFRNYFTLCKILLWIWRKFIFFCHHNFKKKGHSELSKNELENIP